MKLKIGILAAASLIIAGAAAAAPAWTPTRVAATVKTMIPLTHGTSLWLASGFIKNPACQTAKTGYTCAATLTAGLNAEKATLYVTPWTSSSLCVSRVAAAVCAAPLTANDPRACGRTIADGCLLNAARAAWLKQRGPGAAPTCVPAGAMRFTCDQKATISFARTGGVWATRVTG